mmetsp:Transcript_13874/g.33612  ORF Transcript_13874/g.33612 Transcript_13874/m.33612 type:complete len:121 (+) Transcript_13874:245-607(+)
MITSVNATSLEQFIGGVVHIKHHHCFYQDVRFPEPMSIPGFVAREKPNDYLSTPVGYHFPSLFNNIISSQRLNVLVITISLIFKSSSTKNRVCPCTVNSDPSGSMPCEFPHQLPSSYQCA